MREKKTHLYLDGEERRLLLHSLLELKNQLTDMELQSIYFRGCYDSVGYLKKAGVL